MRYAQLRSVTAAVAAVIGAAVIGAAALIVITWSGPVAEAQSPPAGQSGSWSVPRTAWGDPDLQGKWAVADTGTPMERPASLGNREFLTEAEVAERSGSLAKELPADDADAPVVRKGQPEHERGIRGEEYNRFWLNNPKVIRPWNRTSLVVDPPDGLLPPLTREALARLEAREKARGARGEADDWFDRNLSERCLLTAFVRFQMSGAAVLVVKQILQTPGSVAMLLGTLNSNEAVVIPLDKRPLPSTNLRRWLGISRGHWEGTTLVVETTHVNNQQDGGPVMPSRLPLAMPGGSHLGTGETARIVERFNRVAPDTIEYSYTIDDPKTYVRPYTVLMPLAKQADDLLMPENGCHEGNYGIVGQLAAGRADERYALRAARAEADTRKPALQKMRERTEAWVKSAGKTP